MPKTNWEKLFERLDTIDGTLAKHTDKFDGLGQSMATKSDMAEIKKTQADHTTSLDALSKSVDSLKAEKTAQTRHNDRLYRRTEALAEKVGSDLSKIDAEV